MSASLSSRRSRNAAPSLPLGSLTQVRAERGCTVCGSAQVTRLAMRLTDGTPVTFSSCRNCEARRWDNDGLSLSVEDVLERSRKVS